MFAEETVCSISLSDREHQRLLGFLCAQTFLILSEVVISWTANSSMKFKVFWHFVSFIIFKCSDIREVDWDFLAFKQSKWTITKSQFWAQGYKVIIILVTELNCFLELGFKYPPLRSHSVCFISMRAFSLWCQDMRYASLINN